jgi:hypothetical protein
MKEYALLLFMLVLNQGLLSDPAKVGGISLEGQWKGIKAGEACGAVAGLRTFDAIVILGEGSCTCSYPWCVVPLKVNGAEVYNVKTCNFEPFL